jgi:S1-C subfamily serine protease
LISPVSQETETASQPEYIVHENSPVTRRKVKTWVYPAWIIVLFIGMLGIGALKAELLGFTGQGAVTDFTAAVNKVEPSVVVIETTVQTTGFFGQKVIGQDSGTGWIVDSSGLIVTNEHVIDGATSITVTLADGRSFPSVEVQSDTAADLAVIKINASNLTAAVIDGSSALAVGQPVAAVGNALDLGISATSGVISRLDASLTFSDGTTINNLIETDAAINPGNSGGPLINVNGEIVGITNAKLVETGVEGIGYAMNISTAISTIDSLVARIK